MNLDSTIALAHRLADVSGEIIAGYFRVPYLSSETKSGEVSSIVTVADREAENAMVDLILSHSPGDGIIREEGENIPSRSGYFWVLDPIDGTSSFAKGLPIFGTLIGLVSEDDHNPILGIVNQPILRERWLGVRGKPTLFNTRVLNNPYVNDRTHQLQSVCLTSTTPLMFITARQRAVAKVLQRVCKRVAFGGDCYNYMTLASGWSVMPMVILESDLKYYDFCALIPILQGVGAVISDWAGNTLTPDSTEVLAAPNEELLNQALKAIEWVNLDR
ncbi:MAG: 3'(2'),5'-bisphosphate nucleotidase CysQ [Chroococcopsis gigantea SAG 12.99]|jgi:inositol-phosphate phosphatase/L-galactose 1-phosphate phosphatase/histidinol-phosphatase|nr:inositol monophosphatase family protein [Chlorogloea purpurea SAG 13.99]MDV3000446.1 3'(2'),5'-bisphosphate nucleotidase CysQ [Chroococcopsis gigantea SAG 12.99]